MKLLRQLMGFWAACMAGVILPVAATVYDALYRQHYRSSDSSWSGSVLSDVLFVVVGSALVGLITGGVGVVLLHRIRRSRVMDYALTGGAIGGLCGASFTAITRIPGDPGVSWAIFTTVPAVSMALGFMVYWFICIRSHAS